MPIGGFISAAIYQRFGREVEAGHHLVLDEIHDSKKTIPVKMAPLVFFGTMITHFFGGSAGREGTAVQMSAALTERIAQFLRLEADDRKRLLVAGIGAGFGSSIGAPLAGALFGIEVIALSWFRRRCALLCIVASFTAYFVTTTLKAPHSHFATIDTPELGIQILAVMVVAGIAFGVAARIFMKLTHAIEMLYDRVKISPLLKPVLGGALLLLAFKMLNTREYEGLGIASIEDALLNAPSFLKPALKTVFTALTLASGFKGGEFVPLAFIGTTLGSALSTLLPATPALLGAVGFAAVFAGTSNAPLACAAIAMKLFGWHITPFAIAACFASYYTTGDRGLYRSQQFAKSKYRFLAKIFSYFKELRNPN